MDPSWRHWLLRKCCIICGVRLSAPPRFVTLARLWQCAAPARRERSSCDAEICFPVQWTDSCLLSTALPRRRHYKYKWKQTEQYKFLDVFVEYWVAEERWRLLTNNVMLEGRWVLLVMEALATRAAVYLPMSKHFDNRGFSLFRWLI